MEIKFNGFPKMSRLSREIIITEKIDGTNASIYIDDDNLLLVGSRTKWITPQDNNHGFAKWAYENQEDLLRLGPGHHFGEWWGSGIQKGYGLIKGDKRFSLFNTIRWNDDTKPKCCSVVPILYQGKFDTELIELTLRSLESTGSIASPGFMKPEGIIIYHTAGNIGFKKTIKDDDIPKSLIK